jgi:hypothetical protein
MPPLVEYHVMDAIKMGGDGCVRLNRQTLMDGSYVYDVSFYNELNVEVFALHPVNLKKAEVILDTIRTALTY